MCNCFRYEFHHQLLLLFLSLVTGHVTCNPHSCLSFMLRLLCVPCLPCVFSMSFHCCLPCRTGELHSVMAKTNYTSDSLLHVLPDISIAFDADFGSLHSLLLLLLMADRFQDRCHGSNPLQRANRPCKGNPPFFRRGLHHWLVKYLPWLVRITHALASPSLSR